MKNQVTTKTLANQLLANVFCFNVKNIDSNTDRVDFSFTIEKYENDITDGCVKFFENEALVPQNLIDHVG